MNTAISLTRRYLWLALAVVAVPFSRAHTQEGSEKKDPASVPRIFRDEMPLSITLTANLKRLRDDRSQESPYRWANVSYPAADGKRVGVPLRVKTHGIWRLKHCEFPPLRFNFANKETRQTLFRDVEKPKIVSSCRDNDTYEQLVLKEMQLYRIYQLLTPQSHRVRTLRITYVDSASGKPEMTRYAFLFEDPDEMAQRLGGKLLKTKGAGADDLNAEEAAIVYLFEYMISNVDFSFNGLHNGELVLKPDGSPSTPVAYDFDFSGAVNAPYATVDPKLHAKNVRERLYRGYCAHNSAIQSALAHFRTLKPRIYALYQDEIGKLMDPGVVKETLSYYDRFFETIASDRDVQSYVLSGCVGAASRN